MKPISRSLVLIGSLLLLSQPALAKKKKKTESAETAPVATEVSSSSSALKLTTNVALGYVYNTYNSASISTGQHALMAKVSANARLNSIERWSLGFSGFYTLLPFNNTRYVSSSGVVDDVSIRFLGLNMRVGYDTPWLSNPWNLQLALGWYLNTTFVKNNRFGYEWVSGPQIYPQLSYRLDEQRTVGGYVKFSPVMDGPTAVLSLTKSYEAAIGFYALFPASWIGNRVASVNFDFAHLSVQPAAVKVISNSTSLNLGVQF